MWNSQGLESSQASPCMAFLTCTSSSLLQLLPTLEIGTIECRLEESIQARSCVTMSFRDLMGFLTDQVRDVSEAREAFKHAEVQGQTGGRPCMELVHTVFKVQLIYMGVLLMSPLLERAV